MTATVLALGALGAARIDVLWVGKAGTFALMFAYPTFLLGHGAAGWQVPVRDTAWVTGGIGLVLAWVAAFAYVGPARRAFTLGRMGRQRAMMPVGSPPASRALSPTRGLQGVSLSRGSEVSR